MAKTTQRAFALTFAILFLITSVGFSGLVIWQMYQDSKDSSDDTAQASEELENQPKDYMQNFEPLGDQKVAELQITDITIGEGVEAVATSTVVVQYTGALASDGSIFDSTDSRGGEPAEFSLEQVIPGFQQGIVGMKPGGQRRILIPAALGYGEQGGGSIPPNSDLVFDVTLESVQ